jgi:hypothetical protein
MSLPGLGLPGLGLAEPDEAPRVETTTEYELAEGSEWRFEVAFGKHVIVKVRITYLILSPNSNFSSTLLCILPPTLAPAIKSPQTEMALT